MIAIQTNERISILNMSSAQFLQVFMQHMQEPEEVRIAAINKFARDNEVMSAMNNEVANILTALNIEGCFRLVGGRYELGSGKDLTFFISEDGKQYSCEEAYRLEQDKKDKQQTDTTLTSRVETVSVSTPKPEPKPEAPRFSDAQLFDLLPSDPQKKEDTPVVETTTTSTQDAEATSVAKPESKPAEHRSADAQLFDLLPKKPEKKEDSPSVTPQETSEVKPSTPSLDEFTKQAIRKLDTMLSGLTHISFFPLDFREGIKRYVEEQNDEIRENTVEVLEKQEGYTPDQIDALNLDFPVPGYYGTSKDLTSCLITYPVMAMIHSPKNTPERFKVGRLVGSSFVRMCPIGFTEDGISQGYVQVIPITETARQSAELTVKKRLDSEGIRARDLEPSELYEYYVEALSKVYSSGSKDFKNASLSKDVVKTICASKKIDEFDASQLIPVDVMCFDARPVAGKKRLSLQTTVGEIIEHGQVRTQVTSATATMESKPKKEQEEASTVQVERTSSEEVRTQETGVPATEAEKPKKVPEARVSKSTPETDEPTVTQSETVEDGKKQDRTSRSKLRIPQIGKKFKGIFLPGQQDLPSATIGSVSTEAKRPQEEPGIGTLDTDPDAFASPEAKAWYDLLEELGSFGDEPDQDQKKK